MNELSLLPKPKEITMAQINTRTDKTAIRLINDLYEAAANTRKKGNRRYLGMSEIGDACDRSLWYSFRGFPQVPLDGRVIMLFRLGDLIETEIIHWLNAAGYRVDGQQLSFLTHGNHFAGHCDGVVHGVTESPHILECKSANRKGFDAIKQAGVRVAQPKYYCQCQCYMGYSGIDRALLAVQCKEDSALHFERIYFSRSEFEALDLRALNIITTNEPEARPFNMDSLNCQWCRFRTYCWFPEETIVADQVCGTCRYIAFKGLKKVCRHPEHVVEIIQWGIGCPDWVEYDSKEPGPKAVALEEIKLPFVE